MHTGLPTFTVWPVGLSVPSWGSMRKTTIVSESMFSARRRDPVGSIAKLRGFLPWVGSKPTGLSLPVVGSMVKIAMLSCPRFEP